MDKIIIKNLSVRGIIGVHSDERQQPQEIVINTILFTNIKNAGQTDDIANTVSYSTVAKKIRTHAENAKRFTVEALAEDIARICLEESRRKGYGACGKTKGDPICQFGGCRDRKGEMRFTVTPSSRSARKV